MRRGVLAGVVAALLLAPAPAAAAIPSVFAGQTISGAPIPCPAQSDGVRVCYGSDNGSGGPDMRLKSFDGTPLEVYVILPPAPTSGSDGPYPLIVQSHGWARRRAAPATPSSSGRPPTAGPGTATRCSSSRHAASATRAGRRPSSRRTLSTTSRSVPTGSSASTTSATR